MATGPDFLVMRTRHNDPALAGVMRGGTIFEQIGQDLNGCDASLAGNLYFVNGFVRFAGRWWCQSRSRVYYYDVDMKRWVISLDANGHGLSAIQQPYSASSYGYFSGLFIANTATNDRAMYYCYSGGTSTWAQQYWRYDPTLDRMSGIQGAWNRTQNPGGYSVAHTRAQHAFFHGLSFGRSWNASQSGATGRHDLGGTIINSPVASPSRNLCHSSIFSLDDRVFLIGPNIGNSSGFANVNNVEEFALGAWNHRDQDGWTHNFNGDTDGITGRDGPNALGILRLGDAAYIFGGGNNLSTATADSGLLCIKITIPTPGGATVKTDLTDPVIPASLRPLIGGSSLGATALHCVIAGFVDDQTDPENPVGYVIWSPQPMLGNVQPSTLFRFNGEGVPMTQIGVIQGDSRFAYPDAPTGSGAYFYAPPSSNPLLDGYLQSVGEAGSLGVKLNYRLAGDPMLLECVDNDVRLTHGVVTAGPFVVGELVTSTADGATGTVTAVNANDVVVSPNYVDGQPGFRGADVITGGTSGASAILNVPYDPPEAGGPFQVAEVITLTRQITARTATVVTVNPTDLEVSAPTARFDYGTVIGGTSGTRAPFQHKAEHAAGRFVLGETVTGGTSGATGEIDRINDTSVELGATSGTFQAGETITGGTSGATRVLSSFLLLGLVNNGPIQIGETITGGTSGATGVVTRARENWNGYGTYVAYSVTSGAFVSGEVVTGGTSGATATTLSVPAPSLRGQPIHTVRFRYHKGSGPTGIGTPNSAGGICTLVPGSALGNSSVVAGNDINNVTADRRTVYSVEWDFLSDGVLQTQISDVKVEAVRG